MGNSRKIVILPEDLPDDEDQSRVSGQRFACCADGLDVAVRMSRVPSDAQTHKSLFLSLCVIAVSGAAGVKSKQSVRCDAPEMMMTAGDFPALSL